MVLICEDLQVIRLEINHCDSKIILLGFLHAIIPNFMFSMKIYTIFHFSPLFVLLFPAFCFPYIDPHLFKLMLIVTIQMVLHKC